jgi:hypothetical protein
MAMDLATLPRTPLTVQLCGDAHLMNFGVFGSPERELLFDINDFDETLPGPFEWDLKRPTTSIVLTGRANRFSAREGRISVLSATSAYREAMQRFALMGTLATWYAHVTIDDVMSMLEDGKARRKAFAWIKKAQQHQHASAGDLDGDGGRRSTNNPCSARVLKFTMTSRCKSGRRRYQGTFVAARRRSGRPGRRSAGSSPLREGASHRSAA